MLIRLSQTPTRCSGSGFGGVKLGVGGRGDGARNAKQGAEGIEGVEAAVETEREFIKVRLQVLRADAVMDTTQPWFEVGKYEMNDGHELFGNLRIAPFRDGHVVIAVLGESGVAAPIIGDDPGTRCHDAVHEAAQRIGAPIRHYRTSRTRPAQRPLLRALSLGTGFRCRPSTAAATRVLW